MVSVTFTNVNRKETPRKQATKKLSFPIFVLPAQICGWPCSAPKYLIGCDNGHVLFLLRLERQGAPILFLQQIS